MAVSMLLAFALGGGPAVAGDSVVRDSVVKVYTTRQVPSYADPWSPRAIESLTGSGCVIAGRRILTSAHVVSDRTFVAVRRNGDSEKHEARVVQVSHEADLALLSVDDQSFWDGVASLPLGPLPPSQGEVLVYGFPLGGDTLSVTRGVVSRVEHQYYLHGGRELLAGQIDAAINAGNSGGPVVRGGELVGIVMQGDAGADNIGYMVPTPVIGHFLDDVADGRYDGFPVLGIDWQSVENKDLRELYRLPTNRTGVLVTRVLPDSAALGLLQRGDVLLSIDGRDIGGDGTLEFRPRERTSFGYVVDARQVGAALSLMVLRAGAVLPVQITLGTGGANQAVVGPEQYDRPPSYFVFAGLVFSPLTLGYLRSFGDDWSLDAPPHLLAELERAPSVAGEQAVVLVKVLASAISEGYHDLADEIVSSVDGMKPRNLADLMRLIEDGADPFLRIGYHGDSREIVLKRASARAAAAAILAGYGIPLDRSADLRGVTERAAAAATPR